MTCRKDQLFSVSQPSTDIAFDAAFAYCIEGFGVVSCVYTKSFHPLLPVVLNAWSPGNGINDALAVIGVTKTMLGRCPGSISTLMKIMTLMLIGKLLLETN